METLLLLLLIPVIIALIGKLLYKREFTIFEMGVQAVLPVCLIGVLWFVGTYSQTADIEIWNGQVTEKVREHGSYVESYKCRCRTVYSGSGSNRTSSQVCDTCYRTHYTVDWFLNTTIGKIQIAYKDRTSRSVYNSPDPQRYVDAYVGEPCAIENTYTNYIKAVPESLFNRLAKTEKIDRMNDVYPLPQYPKVHYYNQVDRILTYPNIQIPNIDRMNNLLSLKLRDIGPAKQANIIVIFTTEDVSFKHVIEKIWNGGKKNDVVVLIGVEKEKIIWSDVITLGNNSGNEYMVANMNNDIRNLQTVEDHAKLINTIATNVIEHFDRRAMQNYEYLADSIEPPTWAFALALIFGVLGSIALSYWFSRSGVDVGGTQRYNRYRRYK